ncbi:hypothetical protein ACFT5B_14250 [Luteimicrobium sp. NPDC057192]|uniref:hypothetical protein n=1 Tax=Luteimicrobium sp. NPDC057192 TaxID=3346042 RepID=UPI003635FEC5
MSAIFDDAIALWRDVRDAFELYREAQYERAELATRGHLLNHEARERGVSAWSLFIGPERRAHRWASDELREWWAKNGRMTFAEFERTYLQGGESL